jgi:hypothetical protein
MNKILFNDLSGQIHGLLKGLNPERPFNKSDLKRIIDAYNLITDNINLCVPTDKNPDPPLTPIEAAYLFFGKDAHNEIKIVAKVEKDSLQTMTVSPYKIFSKVKMRDAYPYQDWDENAILGDFALQIMYGVMSQTDRGNIVLDIEQNHFQNIEGTYPASGPFTEGPKTPPVNRR